MRFCGRVAKGQNLPYDQYMFKGMTEVARHTLPNGLPLTQGLLPNGLGFIIIENHSAPVFHIQTWFKVGSRDEKLDPRLGRTGLAHLFEHMMFRGTATRPDGQFDKILTRNGVRGENATTWFDRTNYYQSMPSSKLDLVLELEADRMEHLALDAKLLDTEREAVLGEYRMGLDDPQAVAYDNLYSNAFKVHPYRCPVIGTEDEIQGFTVADAEYFYRKYYSPSHATVLIVGDVDPREVERLLLKHYKNYTAQDVQLVASPTEPMQTSERRVEFEHAQLSAPKLIAGWKVPGIRHSDQAALHVLVALLTLGRGSRLERAWVDARLMVDANGSVDQFRDPGLLTLGGDVQEGRTAQEALIALDHEIAAILSTDEAALEVEVERARNQWLLSVYQSWSDNEGLAAYLGEYLASADDLMLGFERASQIERIRAAQVRDVAQRYLLPANRTVVVGRPAPEESP